MKKILYFGIALAWGGLLAGPAATAGTISASAACAAQPEGADFNYTLALTNTGASGTDSIATFWLAWVPGQNFLPTDPLSVAPPTGWTETTTHGGSSDGYALQFDASSPANDLAPGSTLIFGFTSADTPAQLMGNSPFHLTTPVLTSFVYSTGPLRGDGQEFVVSFAAPEPSGLMLGTLGALGSLAWWRRRAEA
jgi:hypothetical protein